MITDAYSPVDASDLRASSSSSALLPEDFATIELIVHDLEQDSSASKRKRHALSMAKGRSRQRQELANLRQQRVHLQSVLQRALENQRRGGEIDVELLARPFVAQHCRAFRDTGDEINAQVSAAHVASLLKAYAAAVEMQNSIHNESESTQKRIEQHHIFEAALMIDSSLLLMDGPASSLSSAGDSLRSESPVRAEEQNLRGIWTHFTEDEEPFYFEPYHQHTAHRLIRDMYQESKAFNLRFTQRQLNSIENHYLGWKVQRSVTNRKHLRFHFTKRVACHSSFDMANDLLNETWKMFHSPELYARLYRTVMVSRVVQRVDESTSVILRNSPSDNRTHHVRMVTMVSKVEEYNESGERSLSILTLVVDPPQIARQSRNGIVFLRNAYTYISFTETQDEVTGQPMVEITYGGHGDCPSEPHAMYLLVETGAVLVRWEQVVMPMRLVTAQ